jgi:hypothetical protein
MIAMAKASFERPMYVRTTPRARLALNRVVAAVQATGVEFDGRVPTQEAVLNASWLWMESLDDAELAEIMGRFFPRLEAYLRGEEPEIGSSRDLTGLGQKLIRDANKPTKKPRTPTIIDTTDERRQRKRSG